MNGKNILVTGASSGIGKAMAQHFCEKGADVIGVARNKKVLSEMANRLGDKFQYYAMDLSNLESIQKVFDSCKERKKKLDGLVHCAGITLDVPVRANNIQQMHEIMDINFGVLVEMVRLASSKRYSNDGASIIALSSTASIAGQNSGSLYAASKGAVNLFVKSAAKELSSRGIRVNAIAPAAVGTPMYYASESTIPELIEVTKLRQPFGIIPPESIADCAEFLLTDKAKYITGSIIYVGAGLVM